MAINTLLKILKVGHHILIHKIVMKAVKIIVKKLLQIQRKVRTLQILISLQHSMMIEY